MAVTQESVVARENIWTRVTSRFRRDRPGIRHSFWWHVKNWFGKGRWIGLIVLFVLGVLRVLDPLPVQNLRHQVFDLYQRIQPRPTAENPPTLIVDLDEESLAEIGQRPWPRTIVAQMLQRLMEAGAAVVGFDIIFAEPDRMSPSAFAASTPQLDPETQNKLKQIVSNDIVFANALKSSRAVVGQSGYHRALEKSDARPPKRAAVNWRAPKGLDPKTFAYKFASIVRNIPEVEAASPGLGMITVEADPDGVVRRVPAVIEVQGQVYPSLTMEMLRVAANPRGVMFITVDQEGIKKVAVTRDLEVPTDARGNTWVYFAKPDRDKRYVSAKDVIAGTVPPERIRGKLVLVGTSATGLLDIRNTPISQTLPGVEVHANLLETILAKANLDYPRNAVGREISIALIAGFLMVLLVPMVGAAWTLGLVVVVVGGTIGFSWYQFTELRSFVDITFPVLTTIIMYSLLTYASYAKTAAERKQVRSAFGQYLSPALLEQLADDPTRLKLGGEKREMTMMFSDIRGFTTISETFKSNPEGLTKLINRFLTPLTDMIMKRQGTIDKYMGDAIMAFWNAPMDDPQHAKHALEAALTMRDAIPSINAACKAEADADGRAYYYLKVGIGVNTGDVVVGNMGSDQRFDYSVLGDAVNLASRLEGQSKPYGVTIVVGDDTYQKVKDDFATLELDLIAVKGKKEAVRIHTLVGDAAIKATSEFKALAEKHAVLMAAYRKQDWTGAAALVEECRALDKWELGDFYDLYAERLLEFQVDPPGAAWDGVYIAKSK